MESAFEGKVDSTRGIFGKEMGAEVGFTQTFFTHDVFGSRDSPNSSGRGGAFSDFREGAAGFPGRAEIATRVVLAAKGTASVFLHGSSTSAPTKLPERFG